MSAASLTAIVPMKGHSQRVPRKNVRPLAGRPLYEWIVESLRAARSVERIVIETDSDEIASAAASRFPDLMLLRRPAELEGDAVSMNALLAWHLQQLDGERFLQTHATNPLLSSRTIDRAAADFESDPDHDSLFTVTRLQTRLYDRYGRPLNHESGRLIQTQELPPVYEENSCLYLFTRSSFSKTDARLGERPKMFETPALESVDIDEEHDFLIAEALMRDRLQRKGEDDERS